MIGLQRVERLFLDRFIEKAERTIFEHKMSRTLSQDALWLVEGIVSCRRGEAGTTGVLAQKNALAPMFHGPTKRILPAVWAARTSMEVFDATIPGRVGKLRFEASSSMSCFR